MVIANDFHWAFFSAFIISRLVVYLNFAPLNFKSKILSQKAGNLRANPIFYKNLAPGGNDSYVGMVEDGDVGSYNRANRSLHHFVENASALVAGFALSAFVFPIATFILVLIYAIGRIIHQYGYSYGYGNHGIGFVLGMFSGIVIDGLNFLVAIKGFGA